MGRKLALLIANSDYDDTKLSSLITPEADVDALAKVLRDPDIGGFDEVDTLKNESTRTIMVAIARFFAKKKRDELLLLYFSGHGILDSRGGLYVAGKDTDHELINATAIPSKFINDHVVESNSKQKVLILDCCYSGAFTRGTKGQAGKAVNTANRFNGQGQVVLTATDATQYAWEGDAVIGEAQSSVFTRYLVQGLETGDADRDVDGWITLDEWYDYVYEQVTKETSKQTPGKWANQQGMIPPIAKNRLLIPRSEQEATNQRAETEQGMPDSRKNSMELSLQHRLFLLEELELFPNILGMCRIEVSVGQIWLIYRDSLLFSLLRPGPHSWWGGLFHRWRALKINTRIELLHINAKGRVQGPPATRERPDLALACEVTAELELTSKIVNIENFLQFRDPLSVLLASIQNMLVEMIGDLQYDGYGEWAVSLRDHVKERLSPLGRDDSERRVGIVVEDIFVTAIRPNTAVDDHILQMYQLLERARRELIETQMKAQRDTDIATSHAEQGEVLNIAPSILALQNSPIGRALIEDDAKLQKLMVEAGLNPLQPDSGVAIIAPLTGVYYATPSLASPPFVSVGDVVQVGQVVALIEATLVFNEIQAEVSGRVSELVATHGTVVQKGEVLMRIEPA